MPRLTRQDAAHRHQAHHLVAVHLTALNLGLPLPAQPVVSCVVPALLPCAACPLSCWPAGVAVAATHQLWASSRGADAHGLGHSPPPGVGARTPPSTRPVPTTGPHQCRIRRKPPLGSGGSSWSSAGQPPYGRTVPRASVLHLDPRCCKQVSHLTGGAHPAGRCPRSGSSRECRASHPPCSRCALPRRRSRAGRQT